jgi:DNA polymerase elongation subunit (family B)
MVYCLEASLALSMNMSMGLSGSATSEFAGSFVFEPKPGCYKGVIVIDRNSLYGSIMSKLGIFIDRCAAAKQLQQHGN